MRYSPDDPAFAEDFIEFSDSWSRAQVSAAWAALPTVATAKDNDDPAAAEDALLACLRPKIIGLRLTCVDDLKPITDPADLTPARTEEMDLRLFEWFASVWIVHLNKLTSLGNALGRKLYATSDTSASKETTKPEKAKQPTAHRKSRKS